MSRIASAALWLLSLVVWLSAAPAMALSLFTSASLTVAPGADPGNCVQTLNTAGPASCSTTAGAATATAGLFALGAEASSVGTTPTTVHLAAAVASFADDLSVPGAPDGTTLSAILSLSGSVTGVTGASGFLQLITGGGGAFTSAPGAVVSSGDAKAVWNFDENSSGPFSETVAIAWTVASQSVPGLEIDMAASISGTGFVIDFLDTLSLDHLEATGPTGGALELDVFDGDGSLVGSTVPEPTLGLWLFAALPAIGLLRRATAPS